MKNGKTHLIIGTVICAATMLLFLAFGNKLPDTIPLQITSDGSAENSLPKPLVMFGLPIVFAVINLIKGIPLSRKENASIFGFYIIPAVSVALSIVVLCMALMAVA